MKWYFFLLLFYALPTVISWTLFHFTYKSDNHNSPGAFELVATFVPAANILCLIFLLVGFYVIGINERVIKPIFHWNWKAIIRRIFLLGDQDEE